MEKTFYHTNSQSFWAKLEDEFGETLDEWELGPEEYHAVAAEMGQEEGELDRQSTYGQLGYEGYLTVYLRHP